MSSYHQRFEPQDVSMSNGPCTNEPSGGQPQPAFCMEYTEDALRNLFTSHFAGLAGLVILDRISDGETIIVRKRDGTSVSLEDREGASVFLRDALGWMQSKPTS